MRDMPYFVSGVMRVRVLFSPDWREDSLSAILGVLVSGLGLYIVGMMSEILVTIDTP